jgi:hypothetical protein
VIWSPFLLASREAYETNALAELRRRVLYNPQFSSGPSAAVVARNLRDLMLGPFSMYVTAPLALAAVASFVFLALRRRRTFFVLAVWLLVMLVPVVVAPIVYSRYTLTAVPPMLVATGVALGKIRGRLVQSIVVILLCIIPIRDVWRQMTRWDRQTLTASDQWQYVSGWPAGYATEKAIEWLRARAVSPLAIITSDEWGNPADAVWLRFTDTPNVQLYFAKVQPGQTVVDAPVLTRKWRDEPAQLPRDLPLYYVTRLADSHALIAHNPIVEDPIEILNPPKYTGESGDGVVIYRLR